jgi:Zn-dependent M16 (insulinase) family peptidase
MSKPNTDLKTGQVLDSGFVILDVVDMDEMQAVGILAKHEKSGAEVFHVLNDDSENLFSFTFKTFPQDNTGAAHILEHSVLCGSRNYPLKDAFIILAQGSLQTFLNAMTFPDKTVYPASSTNEHDYFNLMSVYGDAVFRPLLPEWTFMQEGHRYEYQDGKLIVTGVVFNEMKGAYSSLDSYASTWSVKAVLPGTPYAFDSGGDPQEIPQLTWEGLKDFHLNRYSPANCKVFLAGNIPTEKQLSFLNEQFFSKIDSGKECAPVNKTERWKEPKKFTVPCPAEGEAKSTIFLSWLCSDVIEIEEVFALSVLAEILLGHDGSPLTRKLIESGYGEDITPVSGLEFEIRESLFVAGLKGVSGDIQQMGEKVEKLIMDELNRLVTEGIPPEEIEAAVLSVEFAQREIRRSNGPFSLVWMRRSLRTWLHGCKPWEGMLILPLLAKLKETISSDKRFFEKLIKKYYLDNPHRALVILEPKEDFLQKQDEKFSQKLADTDKNLSREDRQKIIEKAKELEKIQSEADSPQALAAIPHLSRNDLAVEDEIIKRRHEDLRGIPALCHDLFTNGITYISLAFPVDFLSEDDYLWLPFFAGAVSNVGLPGMDYGEVASLLARTVGDINIQLFVGHCIPGSDKLLKTASGVFDLSGRDWLVINFKCLDEKISPSLDLVLRLISETDFSDHDRITNLVLEMKTEISSGLAPMGHRFAAAKAGRGNSINKKTEEIWRGLSQLEFVHRLAGYDAAAIAAKLKYLLEKISRAGLIANITGLDLKAGEEISQRFARFGAPKPRPALIRAPALLDKAEVFASGSLQIGFAARAMSSAAFDTKEQVAETVLAHGLSTGAFWEDIRMKGGAYGAFAQSDTLDNCVSFATYRDPNPLRSLETFSAILNNTAYGECDEEEIVKNIIGCYSKETYPMTNSEKGKLDFSRFLAGMDESYRRRRIERLVSISTADIKEAFSSLGKRPATGTVIIAGTKAAEQAAKALGTDVQVLPV